MKTGWEMKTVGDVCYNASSNVSQNRLENETGEYSIYGASGKIKNISFYHQEKPYLSIVKDGSGYGRITKMDAFTSVIGTLQYILPKDDIDLNYLYYNLISINFKKYVAGAAIPHIYFKDYKGEPFLWMPLPEQQRIVAILDKAFEAIGDAKANAEQNLKNAKELFESYLQNIFNIHGKKWRNEAFGEVCEFIRGPFGGSLKKNIFKECGYAVYEQQHAIYNKFNDVRYFIDEHKFREMKRFEIRTGDLIMSCSGTMGKMAIVPSNIKKGIINQALLKLTPTKKLSVKFLKLWMQSTCFQKSIKTFSQGAAIQNIASVKILKEILIPVPSVEEQLSVVSKVEMLSKMTERLEDIYQKKIEELEQLKKAVLKKYFTKS